MPLKTIEQVHAESLVLAKSSEPKSVLKGKLYKWKGVITSYVIAELKFCCSPHFGLTIFDSNFHIPCIILNPIKNVNQLLKLCDHTILINEPELIVEIFVKDSSEYSLVYIVINAEKLHIIEKNMKMFTKSLKRPTINPLKTQNEDFLEKWCQECVPLKISSAVLTVKSEILCFVLVLLINSEQSNPQEGTEPFWLILRNEQIVWKDFLLPNRIYTIYNPSEVPRDYFKCYGSLLSVIDKNLDQSFHQMTHHKDLIKTNAAVFLPKTSKIYTSSKNPWEKISCPETWFSILDIKLQSLKFASIYGKIKEIKYFESWKSGSCLWCNTNNNFFENTFQNPNAFQNNSEDNDINFEWNNPAWKSNENIEDDNLCFPEAPLFVLGNEKISGFGIKGGKLTMQIALQKPGFDDVVYIFLKRWQQEQYPAGLIEGVTACFTDLSIKRSQKKNLYFIATPLTRVFHLNTTDTVSCDVNPWGTFGFPIIKIKKKQIWGVLDLDLLCKVSISAKCKLCNNSFSQFRCSNVMCSNSQKQMCPDYEVTATARLFVRGFYGSEASALFLKNENVQKYLGIPGRIWLKLCLLSANSELLYIHQRDQLENRNENEDIISTFFRTYCQFFRPKIRFHVLCRSFKNDENRFFCIELREITEQRLLASRNAIDWATVGQKKC